MTFDYRTLKNAEKNGQKLGNWNGKPVFAASASHLGNCGSGAYYIVYDDDNVIVACQGNKWQSYGSVSESGNVSEYSRPRNYNTTTSTSGTKYGVEEKREAAVATYAPGYDMSERPVGDVKTEIDVDAVLKKARTMTVEDLLAGFDYGLDVAKG